MKKNVLIIYGGKSVEHDISIITAVQAMKSLPEKYDFLPVYIDKNGAFWTADNLNDISVYKNFNKLAKNKKEVLIGQKTLYIKKKSKLIRFCQPVAVLNCCHGRVGEDGSLQGLFESYAIPYSSCGVVSSALCMDKTFFKDVLKANNILSSKYAYIGKYESKKRKESVAKFIGFPLIIKPANLGSSIGISVCKTMEECFDALELAFNFDNKVLIEKLVENLSEFNCACFEFKSNIFISSVNQVDSKSEIYTFEEKYLSSKSKNIEVEKSLANKIKKLTEKVYKLFDCKGVVRVDFLYDNVSKKLYVNEVNTIPGSLAVYLFKDIPAKEIILAMIDEAIEKQNQKQQLISTFDSDAIEIYSKFKPTLKK